MFDGTNSIYKIAFDATSDGVIFVDCNAIILSANQSIETLLGYNPEELIGKDMHILVPKYLEKIHRKHFKSFFEEPNYWSFENFREVNGLKKDGSTIPLELRLDMFEYKGKKYAKAMLTDFTTRKEKRNKLEIAKMKLEEKVVDNTKELKRLVLQLQKTNVDLKQQIKKKNEAENRVRKALFLERELNHLKTRFLSLASHEFRTPLSGILTSAILIDKNNKKKDEKITKHVKTIKTMVNHLSNILEDFMSLEKIESGDIHYKFTTFRFNDLMDEIIKEASSLLKKGQKINYQPCEKCPEIYQDKKIVKIILNNLLYNAIKYSPEGVPICINVKTEDYITISIADKGIGIPEKDQPNIFKRFYRASNAIHLQGTGIGLNIVKANVRGLGGFISFTSEENKGTTFIVKLPVNIIK